MDLRDAFWPLLGLWTGVERVAPDGAEARAMLVLKLDLGDRAVLLDYRRVASDGTERSGHGVFVLDPATHNVLWWYFDSATDPPTAPLRGLWADGALVLGPRREHELRLDGDRLVRTAPGLTGTYARLTVGH